MQQNYVTRDRCVLLLALFIFTIGTYSLFASTNNLYEATTFQNRVKGTVTDSNGIPIPGVTIKIKGTSTGTFTNNEGVFFINTSSTDVLILTYIGFRTLEVPIGNSTELSLILQEDITSLDEVTVNAGYYTVKERERTGNISKVTSEEIELQPIVSPLEALQGRMAGVEIVQRGGVPGAAPKIQIRGQNSLRTGNTDNGNLPLYIIDGVPVNSNAIIGINSVNNVGIDPLSTMNLSNIKSIEVLKDADATAIYGSRGSNGVILITTKSNNGLNQKTTVELQLYSGIGKVSNKMELLNTQQYLEIRKTAFENDGVDPLVNNAEDLVFWDQNRYTDWQEKFFGGSAFITDLNISVSGGNATTSFRLGGSYHEEGTVFPGNFGYQKGTFNLNLNHKSENNKFKANISVNYGMDSNNLFNGGSNFVEEALFLPPNAPSIYNADGSLNWENNSWDNPFAFLFNDGKTEANNLVTNLGLDFQLVKGLNLKANLGYTKLDSKQETKTSRKSYRPDIREETPLNSRHSNTHRQSWIIEPQITYSNYSNNNNLDLLIGVTFQQSANERLQLIGEGYASESLVGNIHAAEEISVHSNTDTKYKYNALFGRLGYNWKHKYFINFTARRDGSSRFGSNNQFSNFGAIGAAWIFSEETFVKNNFMFLSFGKLRSSYGITGNDQIPDYGYLDTYEPTPGPGGLYPTQLTNPDYSWEENKKLEAAIELGVLKDRINLNVSWYRNRSSNQLVGFPLPATTGFSTIQANLPAVIQNTGWELEVSTLNIQSKNIRWQTFLNLTYPKNKLISFPTIDQTSYKTIYKVGYPLNIDMQYQFAGISLEPETNLSLYKVNDINADGRYDYQDQVVIKNRGRKYYGGINNILSFKNFSVQFLWQFVKQNSREPFFPIPGTMANQPIEVYDAYKNRGKSVQIQDISQSIQAIRSYSHALNTDYFMSDASFLRLKTLSITYSLPRKLIKQIGLTNCNIFLSAQNLITITNYRGLDPQYSGATTIPTLQTISCGLYANL